MEYPYIPHIYLVQYPLAYRTPYRTPSREGYPVPQGGQNIPSCRYNSTWGDVMKGGWGEGLAGAQP